ncbi:glucose-6-phosphate exchanger SLC37A2 [Zootermopsis nevadensis]|uniref:glucose-6-phosphate exchanger SLC37A2 n=1 Tax=Zootermopsis nevadensis TaxID=136037 RepID=UPI000B8E4544|nr:glucose-6-phosphate exchanger SLC37A2 [Zootermopsis nevadensis]
MNHWQRRCRGLSAEVEMSNGIPVGICLVRKASDKCCSRTFVNRTLWYRASVFILTYAAYTCYHLSRKPISVVKNVLNKNCSDYVPPPDLIINATNKDNWCDWAPFGDKNAAAMLGALDSAYLFAYAASMFLSGFLAERANLRYFLALGMITSGLFSYLFGIAKSYGIHNMWYFTLVQILSGVVQSTGWPGVVTVVGNWFGKRKRGIIFGLWNSHTSMGNILGSLIAGEYVEGDWSLSFIVPGILIAGMGFVVFLFLVVRPADVNCPLPDQVCAERLNSQGYETVSSEDSSEGLASCESDDTELGNDYHSWKYGNHHNNVSEGPNSFHITRAWHMHLSSHSSVISKQAVRPLGVIMSSAIAEYHGRSQREDSHILTCHSSSEKPIGFTGALKIPGVVEYSLSLFFAKLVSYTFLYWLPLYIKSSTTLSPTESAQLSTLFDVGGIVGAIVAGGISDYSGKSASTCAAMLSLAIPMMFVYEDYGTDGFVTNVLLLAAVGFLVNGPYALITTAVSADLGTHHSLEGNAKALATVSAIIDGTGSVGAAVGPLVAGFVSNMGWQYVFYMLMTADVLALLFLVRLVKHEFQTSRLCQLLFY